MEWLKSLNEYAGILAFLALIATIVVPFILYWKGKKDARKAAKDELDAMNEASHTTFSMDIKNDIARKSYLQKQAKK